MRKQKSTEGGKHLRETTEGETTKDGKINGGRPQRACRQTKMEGSNVGKTQMGGNKGGTNGGGKGKLQGQETTGENTCDLGNSADGNKDKEETTDNEKQGKEK